MYHQSTATDRWSTGNFEAGVTQGLGLLPGSNSTQILSRRRLHLRHRGAESTCRRTRLRRRVRSVLITTMRFELSRNCAGLTCLLLLVLHLASLCTVLGKSLDYQPAPADNPLKGFVSYPGTTGDFPHSMEWGYFALRDVVIGKRQYDWSPLERQLQSSASKGYQFCCRFYLEWPGKPNAIPQYLLDDGMAAYSWTNTNTQPFPPAVNLTPDYEDERLRTALKDFVAEFGRKYDGDPRLGFINLGLLGTWGEWHNHPSNFLFASKTVQAEVYEAYEKAFKTTRLLARYPAGESDPVYSPNQSRRLGYHDDSFAWATVHTGRKEDDWYFESRLRRAGALEKWRSQPIGGEVRPEVWDCLFADPSCAPLGQDYARSLSATHVTWLANHGVFRKQLDAEVRARAVKAAQQMGYELYVSDATLHASDIAPELLVTLSLTNTGVAPFYYDWPVELGACTRFGQRLVQIWPTQWKLPGIQPGQPSTVWARRIGLQDLAEGEYQLLARVRNPMPTGRPVRFANTSQDHDMEGWLTLGDFTVRKPQPPPQPATPEESPQTLRVALHLIRLQPNAALDLDLLSWLGSMGSNAETAPGPVVYATAGRRDPLPPGLHFDRIAGPGLLSVGDSVDALSLIDSMRGLAGAEILSFPAKDAPPGDPVTVHVSEKTPIRTGILDQALVSPRNSTPRAGSPFVTTELDCGIWFAMEWSRQGGSDSVLGRIQLTTVEFDGYRADASLDPAEVWFNGESRWVDAPFPRLTVRELLTSVEFIPGSSLLLGSWAGVPESMSEAGVGTSASILPGADPAVPVLLVLLMTDIVPSSGQR